MRLVVLLLRWFEPEDTTAILTLDLAVRTELQQAFEDRRRQISTTLALCISASLAIKVVIPHPFMHAISR